MMISTCETARPDSEAKERWRKITYETTKYLQTEYGFNIRVSLSAIGNMIRIYIESEQFPREKIFSEEYRLDNTRRDNIPKIIGDLTRLAISRLDKEGIDNKAVRELKELNYRQKKEVGLSIRKRYGNPKITLKRKY